MKFLITEFISILILILITSNENYDLVIIGGGLAGLTAAYESNLKSNNTLNIVLIEQASNIGGNSNRATSGINLLETPPQKENNIIDNYTIFFSDTMKSGKYINNPSLVSTFINGTKTLYDYYTNNFGIDITLLGILGGHSVARTHRPTDSNNVIGSYLINKVFEKINQENNDIKILYNSTVIELLKNETENNIYGIKYIKDSEIKEIYCKAVILTSGGYGHDFGENGLLKEFVPQYMNYPTTNGELTLGFGIKLARAIGADLVNMEQVQVHPTGFVDLNNRYIKKKFLAPELLRGVGGILLNQKGERFCNELGTRDYITNKIIQNCQKQDTEEIEQYECFLVMNQEMAEDFGINNFYFYKNIQGFIKEHNNFTEMANDLNINYNKIKNTIDKYNSAFDKKLDEFNKTTFPHKFYLDKTVYSMIITPSIHYTMGGLKINNKGEVLNSNNQPIQGLFGAGEVTGGIHGGNRLGGNSLAECGVYGRISANSAVEYILFKDKIIGNNHIFFMKMKKRGINSGAIVGIVLAKVIAVFATLCGMFLSLLSFMNEFDATKNYPRNFIYPRRIN